MSSPRASGGKDGSNGSFLGAMVGQVGGFLGMAKNIQ